MQTLTALILTFAAAAISAQGKGQNVPSTGTSTAKQHTSRENVDQADHKRTYLRFFPSL